MKVLWVTYVCFPEAKNCIEGKNVSAKGSGGWLFGAAQALLDNSDIELRVATVTREVKSFKVVKGTRITYYLIPFGRGTEVMHHGFDQFWQSITEEYHPDVVHVHGIESCLALSYCKVCGNKNVVVSIQGIKSVIGRYFFDGITPWEIIRNITLRDVIRCNTQFSNCRKFVLFEKYEREILNTVKYVIGRTDWDKSHVLSINQTVNYFHCNETLRDVFYSGKWEYSSCTPYTIFLSASNTSFKGAHFLFKALPFIIRRYPNVKVNIAGDSSLTDKTIRGKLYRAGYSKYIQSLINKFGLNNHICFLGKLDDDAMKKAYLDCNVFVCPSTIENSSNSVCEAQLLGVPVIASYVGGIPDFFHGTDSRRLYRCREYEMLADKICEVFYNPQSDINDESRRIALERHDKITNAKQTIEIYKTIVENGKK